MKNSLFKIVALIFLFTFVSKECDSQKNRVNTARQSIDLLNNKNVSNDKHEAFSASDIYPFVEPRSIEDLNREYGKKRLKERWLWQFESFEDFSIDQEVIEERTEYAKVFRKQSPGEFTTLISAAPLHYFENGKWNTIYQSIIPEQDGGFSNHFNINKSDYPSNIDGEISTKLYSGHTIIEMQDMKIYFRDEANPIEQMNVTLASNSEGVAEGPYLTYSSAFGNVVDVKFSQTSYGRKMDYIINNPSIFDNISGDLDVLVFEEKVSLGQSLLPKLINGEIKLFSKNGREIAKYERPNVNDSNSAHPNFDDIRYEIDFDGNDLTIKTVISLDYLMSDSRSYPITVDPTLYAYPSQTSWHTGYSWSNTCATSFTATSYTDQTMVAGTDVYYSSNTWLQSWMKFDISSLCSTNNISYARVRLYEDAESTGNNNLTLVITPMTIDAAVQRDLAMDQDIDGEWNSGYFASNAALNQTGYEYWLFDQAGRDFVFSSIPSGELKLGLAVNSFSGCDEWAAFRGHSESYPPMIQLDYQATSVATTASSLSSMTACSGSPSSSSTFSVSGTNLGEPVTVTAPAGFEVSTNNSSFSSSLTVGSTGSLANTVVYVRMSSSATGSPSGDVTCSSVCATTKNVSVSGTVNPSPTGVTANADGSGSAQICSGATVSLSGSGTSNSGGTTSTSESGSGGVADNSNSYPGTPIVINFPALPAGSTVNSVSVTCDVTTVVPSWLSEVLVQIVPPAAMGGTQSDLSVSSTNAQGSVSGVSIGSFGANDPEGTWTFNFKDTYPDGMSVNANITDVTITVNYDATGSLSYAWSEDGGTTTFATGSSATSNALTSNTTITLTATDDNNGCASTATASVTVNGLPSNSSVAISSSSSPPKNSEDLICISFYSDPESATVYSENDWRVDGTSFAVQNFSFDADGSDGLTSNSSQGGALTANGDATQVAGVKGQAYEFDGDTDYLQNSSLNIDPTQGLSVSLWTYTEQFG